MKFLKQATFVIFLFSFYNISGMELPKNAETKKVENAAFIWKKCIDQEYNLEKKAILLDAACEIFEKLDKDWYNDFSENACLAWIAVMTESDDIGDRCFFGEKILRISNRFMWKELSDEIIDILLRDLLLKKSDKNINSQLYIISNKNITENNHEETAIDEIKKNLLNRQKEVYRENVRLFESTLNTPQPKDNYAAADRHGKLRTAIKKMEEIGVTISDQNLQNMYEQFALELISFLCSCTNASEKDQIGRIVGIYEISSYAKNENYVLDELASAVTFKFLPLLTHGEVQDSLMNKFNDQFKRILITKYLQNLDLGLNTKQIHYLQPFSSALLESDELIRFNTYYIDSLLNSLYEALSKNEQDRSINILRSLKSYLHNPQIKNKVTIKLQKIHEHAKVLEFLISDKYFDLKSLSTVFLSFKPDKITDNSINLTIKNYDTNQDVNQLAYEFRFASIWAKKYTSSYKNMENFVSFLNDLNPFNDYKENLKEGLLEKFISYYVNNLPTSKGIFKLTDNFPDFIKELILKAILKKGGSFLKEGLSENPLEIYNYAVSLNKNDHLLNDVLEQSIELLNSNHLHIFPNILELIKNPEKKIPLMTAFFKSISQINISTITPFLLSQNGDFLINYLIYYSKNSSQFGEQEIYKILCTMNLQENDELFQIYLVHNAKSLMKNRSWPEAVQQIERINNSNIQKKLILKIWKSVQNTEYNYIKFIKNTPLNACILDFTEIEMKTMTFQQTRNFNVLAVLSSMLVSADIKLYPSLYIFIKEKANFVLSHNQMEKLQHEEKITILDAVLNVSDINITLELGFMDFLYESYYLQEHIRILNASEKARNMFLAYFMSRFEQNVHIKDIMTLSRIFLNLNKETYPHQEKIKETSYNFVNFCFTNLISAIDTSKQLSFLNEVNLHYTNLNDQQKSECAERLKSKLSLKSLESYDFISKYESFTPQFKNLIISIVLQSKNLYPQFTHGQIEKILETLQRKTI